MAQVDISFLASQISGVMSTLNLMSTTLKSINTWLGSIEFYYDPMAKFGLAFQETGSATSYYCYQNRNGNFFMKRFSTSTVVYMYSTSGMESAWTSRGTLTFNSFGGVF